jgi:hypothetical protein
MSAPYHPDYDDYTVYTAAFKYPHNPQPVVPTSTPEPCQQPVNGQVSFLALGPSWQTVRAVEC